MIYRLLFLLLFTTSCLLGQTSHLLPAEIQAKKPLLDSLGFNFIKLNSKLLACGQFNQQAAATLISDDGLILIARSALLPYLPENVNPKAGFWARNSETEILIPKALITFQLDYQEVTSQLLTGVNNTDSEITRSNRIARNRVQLSMKTPRISGETKLIKELNSGQTFHSYRLRSFSKVHLVGLPPEADAQSFALLRIIPQNNDLGIKSLAFSTEQIPADTVKAVIIDFPANSHFNASSHELALHQIRNEISYELDLKVIEAYQGLGIAQPSKLLTRNQQNEATRTYFQKAELLSNKKAMEQSLLLDPACRKTLAQLDRNFDKFETLYALYTYGQEGFSRIKLYQLVKTLNQAIARGPVAYEKNRGRLRNHISSLLKDWNVVLDQEIFAAMAETYFSKTKAQYLSPETIEKIAVTNKSYADLADLLYTNTLLTPSTALEDLLAKDLNQIEQALQQDLAFRFLSQLAADFEKKIVPIFRKQYSLFQTQTSNLAQQRRSYLPDQWITEANGSQRMHFTGLSLSNQGEWRTNLPGLPNTDMAPILDSNGRLLGFRLENEQLSGVYEWSARKTPHPIHHIVSSSSILKYFATQPQGSSFLKEIKKAP